MEIDREQLQAVLEEAAEKGAKKVLHEIGLDDEYAADNIHDLRSFIRGLNVMRRTACRAFVNGLVGAMLFLLAFGFLAFLKKGGLF